MVVTRSNLDTSRGLSHKVSRCSRKIKATTTPFSSEQPSQKRKSASDPSPSKEPPRKKHARENRIAIARSSDAAPLNEKRKSGDGDSLPFESHNIGPADDSEPCSKKLKVAAPAAEESYGRKLLSPGPTVLSMPREIRDMILGYTIGNRTLHIEQGNTWNKFEHGYQILDRNVLRHAVCQACVTTLLGHHRKAEDQLGHDEEPRTHFQRHLKCCRPNSDQSRGYETPSFVSNEAEHIMPAILRTCHQLHKEGTTVLYGSNTFSFTDPSSFQAFMKGRTMAQTSVIQSIELSATAESQESANSLFMTPKRRSEHQGFYQCLSSWGLHELSHVDKLKDIQLYYLDQTPLNRLRGRNIEKLKSTKTRLVRRGLRSAFGDLRYLDCVKSPRRLAVRVGEYFGPINCDTNTAVHEPRDNSSFARLFNGAAGCLGDSEVDRLAEEFRAEAVSPVADLRPLFHQEVVNDAEQTELLAISAPCLDLERQIRVQISIAKLKIRERFLLQGYVDAHRRKMDRYEFAGRIQAPAYLASKHQHEVQTDKAALARSAKVAATFEAGRLHFELNGLRRDIDQRVHQTFWPLEDLLQTLRAALSG